MWSLVNAADDTGEVTLDQKKEWYSRWRSQVTLGKFVNNQYFRLDKVPMRPFSDTGRREEPTHAEQRSAGTLANLERDCESLIRLHLHEANNIVVEE
jgi:hypothetical protein